MELDPASLDQRESYQLLISAIVPRPIALVATISEDGVANLAPFSFFTGVCSKPPMVGLSVVRRRGEKKDTLRNIEANSEFVVNVVSAGMAQAMNQTAADYAPEVDEFSAAGLTQVASLRVRPSRVGESLISLECRLVEIKDFGKMPYISSFVIGEVVQFHLKDAVYEDGVVDFGMLNAVGRMGRDLYCHTGDVFEMNRPRMDE